MFETEGNPIATEVEYGGLNDAQWMLTNGTDLAPTICQAGNVTDIWFSYFLDYVELCND